MNEYMIEVRFVSIFSEDFVSLIPGQRKMVDELVEKGIITGYSLSADRRILWISLLASSREAADKTMQMMPLFKYMHYEIYDLMFHHSATYSPMRFSMN